MSVTYFNDADEAFAFVSSVSFYSAITTALMGLVIALISMCLYGDKLKLVKFGRFLRKVAIFLMKGSMLLLILPLLYGLEATIIFRSFLENCYIILTKVFM